MSTGVSGCVCSHRGTCLPFGKAVRLPPVPGQGSRGKSHRILARVYLFIFQQKLKRRGKRDNTSVPRGL